MFTAAHAFGLCGLYFVVSGDMGNGLVFLFIFICMAFVAGFALRWFALLLGGGAAAVIAAWNLDLMPSYMKDRFIVLFDHSYEPLDAGWQQTRACSPWDPEACLDRDISTVRRPRVATARPCLPGGRILSSPWREKNWAWWAAWQFCCC